MTRRRTAAAVLAGMLAGLLVLTGCTSLPESGPVVDVPGQATVDDERPSDINAVGPTQGMSPGAVVAGFLAAMRASPTRIDVAQQFLTPDAASTWEPSASTIVYSGPGTPRGSASQVSVALYPADLLDASGAFVRQLTGPASTLRFSLAFDGTDYRITNPPDALVVPRGWFSERYRQASLYYFDPSGRILVPQPVYVPRGDSFVSTLVARLQRGPGPDLARYVRSYVPRGLEPRATTEVVAGVAEIDLGGEAPVNGEVADRMLAQLAWTLGQGTDVTGIRVTLGGALVRGTTGGDPYAVDQADEFDPNGTDPSEDLYAVRDRVLLVRDGNQLEPVPGPFGSGRSLVRSAAPNIDGSRAAGVGLEGRSLLVADLADASTDPGDPGDPGDPADPGDPEPTAPADTGSPDPTDGTGDGRREAPASFVFRGTDLLTPAWDFLDRVWVVDRTPQGARVHVVTDGVDQQVPADGITGADVRRFLVSRDGTRFVAVVRSGGRDEVRVGRVQTDEVGAAIRVRDTRTLALDLDLTRPSRITDVAWSSPTTLALLTPQGADDRYEVRAVGVDGSPSLGEAALTPVPGPVLELAGSPITSLPTLALRPDNFIDLRDTQPFGFVGEPASSIFYAG